MNGPYKVSVIVPAYNEEANLEQLVPRVRDVLGECPDYEILVIDDGSTDGTLAVLQRLHRENPKVRFLSFSRNFGHQNALKAGLDHATGDCVISMDADFQHPPALIPAMIARWREGNEIVQTLRREDASLSWIKRRTSSGFYRVLNYLANVRIEQGAADFRLLDRRVVDALKNINEYHLFLRGLVVWVGFRQCHLEYAPEKRHAGQTKYSLRRMLSFAMAGITAFSVRPLHLSVFFAALCALAAFGYSLYAIGMRVFTNAAIPGWASVLVSVLTIGGMQLIVLGIIGEYLGKLFIESKHRPHYIIKHDSTDPKD